jgi:hypothetical protein
MYVLSWLEGKAREMLTLQQIRSHDAEDFPQADENACPVEIGHGMWL